MYKYIYTNIYSACMRYLSIYIYILYIILHNGHAMKLFVLNRPVSKCHVSNSQPCHVIMKWMKRT